MAFSEKRILAAYDMAKESYAERGVDLDTAVKKASLTPVSMHCWQGDDVIGYDQVGGLTGGIATTGNYPGRARTPDELRADIDVALGMIPGRTKLNLHASYAELQGKKVDRDQYTCEQFENWIAWAAERGIGLDFNPTFFSHPMNDGNFSLASSDEGKRRFWIEHGKRCREIGEQMGRRLGQTCVVNYWMPDGFKDLPAETALYRERMTSALDEIFAQKLDENYVREAVESKLFGLGVECYTVANHEYSLCYALTRGKAYCMDTGHFHPTEKVSDKISSVLGFVDRVLLHLSRGVRWDSDHVVIWDDELQNIMREVFVGGFEDRVYIAQDYFDASMNRIACWVIAMRNTRRAILKAISDPWADIAAAERTGDFTGRLALMEENKTLPFAAVWDYFCMVNDRPVGADWIAAMRDYESRVQAGR